MTDKRITIMRGLPGSGKSTLAQALASGGAVFSTDDYFMVDGEYVFDPSRLGEYHGKNLARTVAAMEAGAPCVVVDNTMVQAWEAREYVRAAVRCGYVVEFVEANTPWAKNPAECARRCGHGVPQHTIKAMLERWEDVTVDKALAAKAPWEKP